MAIFYYFPIDMFKTQKTYFSGLISLESPFLDITANIPRFEME
jgi:hypothetical protein